MLYFIFLIFNQVTLVIEMNKKKSVISKQKSMVSRKITKMLLSNNF